MYAVGAVDDRTGWAFVLPVPSREGKVAADAMQAIEASVASLMAYAGLRVGGEEPAVIRILQTDNAAEFRGGAFAKLCKKRGIAQRFTSAYLHQNNSFVEGVWRDILNGTRALLLGAKLPKEFWPHAMRHYTFIRNRTPKVGRLQGISPYQVLFRTPPDMSRLKTFGCTAYQYLDYDQRSEDIPSEEFSPPASMECSIASTSDSNWAQLPSCAESHPTCNSATQASTNVPTLIACAWGVSCGNRLAPCPSLCPAICRGAIAA